MYILERHVSETMAIVALSLYVQEDALLSVTLVFTFGLVEVSYLFVESADLNLIATGKVFLACNNFASEIAMIPYVPFESFAGYMFWLLIDKNKDILI